MTKYLIGLLGWLIIVVFFCAVRRKIRKDEIKEKNRIEAEKDRRRMAEEKAKEMRWRAEKEIDALVEKYLAKPITQKAAKTFSDRFISHVNHCNRDKHVTDISCEWGLGTEFNKDVPVLNGIKYVDSVKEFKNDPFNYYFRFSESDYDAWEYLLNFYKENLKPISNRIEMSAFIKAISLLAYNMILDEYKKDKSGSEYTLTIKVFDGYSVNHNNDSWEFSVNDRGYAIIFTYTAPNGFYEPPQEW